MGVVSQLRYSTTPILPKGYALWTPECSKLRFSHFERQKDERQKAKKQRHKCRKAVDDKSRQ